MNLETFQAHRNNLGNPLPLHGDPVESVHDLHGPAVMGHQNNLGVFSDFSQQIIEPIDVGFIQRRVHFVEKKERTRLDQVNGEDKRHGDQRFFTP